MHKYVSLIPLAVFLMAGCASTPKVEYDWVDSKGELASPEEVQKIKAECNYDEKIKEAASNMATGISVSRYDSQYGPKNSDKYSKKAADLMSEAAGCVREKGLSTRERVKT